MRGPQAVLIIRTSEPGRIAISGPRLRRAVADTTEGRAVRLRLRLNRAGARALRKRGSLRSLARVRFRADNGTVHSRRVAIRFKRGGNR